MPFLKKAAVGPHDLALAMTGVRLGERLLNLGLSDPALAATLATKPGLSGRAVGVDSDESRIERARAAAASTGVFMEFERAPFRRLPFASDSFDVVVIHSRSGLLAEMSPQERSETLHETWRVLRPGGRCVAIEAAQRGGVVGLFARAAVGGPYAVAGGAEAAMRAHGYPTVRTIGAREGVAFIEGLKRHSHD